MLKQQWRLIDSGNGDAYNNMALDGALLQAGIEGHAPPTLRFYGWEPPAVSIGYAQDVATGVNLAACNKRGLALVRRPTGGRGVLHDNELTYAIIVPQDCYPKLGVLATYRIIANGLLEGLSNLGIEASLATPTTPRANERDRGQDRSRACFMAPSRYEITVGGRKLIGSAQRRLKSHILQHGSILLGVDYTAIADLFPASNGSGTKVELVEQARGKITSLEELLGQGLSLERLKREFIAGFMQALAIEFINGEPTVYEQQLAARLCKQKYSARGWNYPKSTA